MSPRENKFNTLTEAEAFLQEEYGAATSNKVIAFPPNRKVGLRGWAAVDYLRKHKWVWIRND